MNVWNTWVDLLEGTDNALLPAAHQITYLMRIGWAIVLAWLVFWISECMGARLFANKRQRHVRLGAAIFASAICVLTLFPGEQSPAFLLGLAFQCPSLMTVACCAYWFVRAVVSTVPTGVWAASVQPTPWSLYWLISGAAGGAILLADTFALLPVSIYALGFGPLAAAVVFGWASVPLAFSGIRGRDVWMWLAPLVVTAFVVTRWPTGNVWDAVLDPLLWAAVCIALVRRLIRAR